MDGDYRDHPLVAHIFVNQRTYNPETRTKIKLERNLGDLFKNRPWIIMLTLTILIFVTLAMKGGSYVYYFNNYVDEASLREFIQPILNFLSKIGLNFFESDLASAGFGCLTPEVLFFQ
jgi:Na+/melibiose symporter-like transporter